MIYQIHYNVLLPFLECKMHCSISIFVSEIRLSLVLQQKIYHASIIVKDCIRLNNLIRNKNKIMCKVYQRTQTMLVQYIYILLQETKTKPQKLDISPLLSCLYQLLMFKLEVFDNKFTFMGDGFNIFQLSLGKCILIQIL